MDLLTAKVLDELSMDRKLLVMLIRGWLMWKLDPFVWLVEGVDGGNALSFLHAELFGGPLLSNMSTQLVHHGTLLCVSYFCFDRCVPCCNICQLRTFILVSLTGHQQ